MRPARGLRLAGLAALFTASAFGAAAQEISGAAYADPTTRYAHGVLGDAVEWGALVIEMSDGTRRRLTLPETRVFEDLAPRVVDVDLDGAPEVVVIESSVTEGARLAIYDETGLVDATPHIGQPNRWLAPAAIADLDGDGQVELAYVDRPHLAKVLRLWRFEKGRLVHLLDLPGLTNHRIGWDFIAGGLRTCPGRPPEVVLASADWSEVLALRFGPRRIETRELGPYRGPESLSPRC
ncbi:MAG: FG-GAP-like repeat-containing protein [Roseovarius sp.]